MEKYPLTNEDFLGKLHEQLLLLDSSLSNFSNNNNLSYTNKVIGKKLNLNTDTEIESLKIAVIVRVLVYDTNNSHSF